MASGKIVNFMAKGNSSFKMDLIIWELLYKVLHMVKVDIVIIMAVYIKVTYKIIRQMDWVFIMIHFKDISIMVSGKMMYHTVRENKNLKMALIMKENFYME